MVIYVFSDEDGLPKYVGKANDFEARMKQHLGRDRKKYDSWFYRWLNQQIREDRPFYIDILEECNKDNWQEREKYWIAHVKGNNFVLCNMTDGGDGNNNQYFSEETRKKMSLAQKGRKHTQETKDVLSQKHTGKKLSEVTKEKLRQANLGKKYSEELKLVCAKKIEKYTLEGEFIEEYSSLTNASKFLECRKSSLVNALKKKIPKFKGYIWKYK